MNYINSALFGIVQGATEFLPISSSGHLLIMHRLFNLPLASDLTFDVALHLATLLAVVYILRNEIWLLARSFFSSWPVGGDEYSRLAWLIILATLPAMFFGWLLSDYFEDLFRSPAIVAVMLASVGVLFLVAEKLGRQNQDIFHLNWQQSLFIGLVQAVALIPGTSRAGVTIIAGLAIGLKRELAVKFSFLLAVPIIAGAALKELPKILNSGGGQWPVLGIAFIFAFISGLLAIRYFLIYVRRYSLKIFAFYRFVLAAAIIIYFYLIRI